MKDNLQTVTIKSDPFKTQSWVIKGIFVDYSGEYSKMKVSLIKEVSHEQRKKQAKTKCKEKTTA
jgi:hypothetical protein